MGDKPHSIDRTAVAEFIIDEMARRQCHRFGPYFAWDLATENFRQRFDAAWAPQAHDASPESLQRFAILFVDAWPAGMPALRVVPDSNDSIANPPYSKDGMWPAFLNAPARDAKC